MPKLAERRKPTSCSHPDHAPPSRVAWIDGVHRHVCPACRVDVLVNVVGHQAHVMSRHAVRRWRQRDRVLELRELTDLAANGHGLAGFHHDRGATRVALTRCW